MSIHSLLKANLSFNRSSWRVVAFAAAYLAFSPDLTAATLTRAQAVTALLAPGSGVSLNTNQSTVWSPFVNFGGGAGFEGMLPPASTVRPHRVGLPPFPGSARTNPVASYFFWIDDQPDAFFTHQTRFVFINATSTAPTVANGGIFVSTHGWWPVITLPPAGPPIAYFSTLQARVSDAVSGAANPQGLIGGRALRTADIISFPPPPPGFAPAAAVPANNACGLVIVGDPDARFRNGANRAIADLKGHHGVSAGRIANVNNGAASSSADLRGALIALCNAQPPCDKIFIRMFSHGGPGTFEMTDGSLTSSNLCQMLQSIAGKGAPICMLIESCYSGSLLDVHDWNFPDDSVIITSADATNSCWGYTYKDGTNVFTQGAFSYALSKCLNANPTNNAGLDRNNDGKVGEKEAYMWVTNVMPCYVKADETNIMRYPAGSGTNINPGPQIRTVGRSPFSLNVNVCNGTGQPKTDFHIVFKGDVRNGTPKAWRSDANDNVNFNSPWGNATVTYDPVRNETTVSWESPGSPVLPGQYIHFGYYRPQGGLKQARRYWTPTASPAALPDRVPTHGITIEGIGFGSEPNNICVVARSTSADGWGVPQGGQIVLRYSPVFIPLQDLNAVHPAVTSLQPFNIGTLFLNPDQPVFIPLPPVPANAPNPQLIIETRGGWSLNQNQFIELEQIPLSIFTVGPRLQIDRDGPEVHLSWPADRPDFLPEFTHQLPSLLWQSLPNRPQQVGNLLRVTVPIDPAQNQFFRLSNGNSGQ